MKIRPVGVDLSMGIDRQTDRQADGQMDRRDEVNSRFSQCCERA